MPTATTVAIVARPDPHSAKPGGATNHPPVQVASAEAATKTATESKPTSIAANKPIAAPEAAPTTPTAKVNEEPPLEVVSVAENPILPAGEIARPGDLRPVPDAQEVPLVSPVGARTNPARGDPGAAPAAEKRGFLKRINPVNLFRREKPATPDSPALPPQETKALSVEQPAVTVRPRPGIATGEAGGLRFPAE